MRVLTVTDEELKISILVFMASLFAVNMIVICCLFFFYIYCVKIFRAEDSSGDNYKNKPEKSVYVYLLCFWFVFGLLRFVCLFTSPSLRPGMMDGDGGAR